MKLLNYNELKTLLLEERDKIPLTVPGARYEMNIPQPNKHGESMRGGIRIALRCMERCQPVSIDDLRPKGRWGVIEETSSGWKQHRCSVCKAEAIFEYTYIDDYDEGVDGEWEYIGQMENGITEHLTDFCPHCGADMRGG